MLNFLRNWRKREAQQEFTFSRPVVMLQSDDWGRVGVRDRRGFEELRAKGLRLGERAYDLYTLETADDVAAVADCLGRHRDSQGRTPCLNMNVCTANLDFDKMRDEEFGRTLWLPLSQGLPGKWSRPGLFDAYRSGAEKGLFKFGLHGTSHFSKAAVRSALAENGERAQLLRLMWAAETPYIFWRMPWIGHEYWNAERAGGAFLTAEKQSELVHEGVKIFIELFHTPPVAACAPGYRANVDTHRAWSQAGIRVAEAGTSEGLKSPCMDEFGVLHVHRTIDFEPSQQELDLQKYLELADACFARGIPFVISVHAINFHSTLRDFRSPTIAALDQLLSALESKHPELLYLNNEDLLKMIEEGRAADSTRVKVTIQTESNARFMQKGAC